tara:strand:- start:174 stop:581 length:408 start_codon:yes stop_codon:yes gene_type:complete
MILFLISLAFAEPLMTSLSEGQVAPFTGRLFNDEAVASIIAGKEFTEQQCEIQMSLDYSLQLAEKQLAIDYLDVEKETLQKKHDVLIAIRDEEIVSLRKHFNPKRSTWVFFGGFVLGTTSSLATYYAVKQIPENQ